MDQGTRGRHPACTPWSPGERCYGTHTWAVVLNGQYINPDVLAVLGSSSGLKLCRPAGRDKVAEVLGKDTRQGHRPTPIKTCVRYRSERSPSQVGEETCRSPRPTIPPKGGGGFVLYMLQLFFRVSDRWYLLRTSYFCFFFLSVLNCLFACVPCCLWAVLCFWCQN